MEHNAQELDETITQTKKNCIYNGRLEDLYRESGKKAAEKTKAEITTTKLNLNKIEANKRAKKEGKAATTQKKLLSI